MTTVFDRLHVVDFTEGMAGPMCGMVLADNGASVLKIEPPAGDWARALAGFHMWNRGKQSVVLDVGRATDRDRALDLIMDADVVLESWPQRSAPAGLAYGDVRAANPGVVYASIGAFANEALPEWLPPYEGLIAARSGRMTGLDAMSGSASPAARERPIFVASPIGSYAAGMLAVQGIAGALRLRERRGLGSQIETTLMDGLVAATMRVPYKRAGQRVVGRTADERSALLWKGVALTFMTARCADGTYLQMCARQDHHFTQWLEATGLGHLRRETRFARAPLFFESGEDIDVLAELLREAMATRTRDEWTRLFSTEYDVGADPVLTPDEFLRHPQMTENGRIVTVDDAAGPSTQIGPIAVFSATPSVVRSRAPRLGEQQSSLVGARTAQDARSVAAPAAELDELPFDGVTIVELASYLAGPFGATLLAENGARVIKVEPLEGDSFRRVGLESVHLMHGKESIAIDLKTAAGQAILHRLVAGADAVLNNFRVGVADKIAADYETLRAINPGIVYVFASSYGSHGPLARRPAFHSTPHALAGGGLLQAGEGNPPVDDSYPDPCAAIAVASAMAMGLLAKERHGIGQYIETSMICSTGYVHSNELLTHPDRGPRSSVDGDQRGLHPLYMLYPCQEGWIFLAACRDGDSPRLVDALDLPVDAVTVARLVGEGGGELVAIIDKALSSRPAGVWERVLLAAGVPAVVADGQSFEQYLVQHDLVEPDSHPRYGDYFRVRPRVRFSSAPNARGAACELGAQTDALLADLGYSEDERRALVRDRIVGAGPDR